MNGLIDSLNRAAEAWWPYVAHITWQGVLVGVAVLGLVWLGRRWPSPLRYWLLVLGMVKFVMPPMLALPTGVFSHVPLRDSLTPDAAQTLPLVTLASTPTDLPEPHAPDITDAMSDSKANSALSDDQPLAEPVPARMPATEILPATALVASLTPTPVFRWPTLLLLIHALGLMVLSTWMCAQLLSLRRLIRRDSYAAGPELQTRFTRLADRLQIRRPPRLLVTAQPVAPMALGLLRRTVLIPASVVDSLGDHEVETILAHELAHHRRRDVAVNWLQGILCAIWWFNPVVWLLSRAIRRAREDCCDDFVIARGVTGDDAYCDTLLHAASRLTGARRVGTALGFGDRLHPLGRRMQRILHPTFRPAPALSIAGMVVVTALAMVVLPGLGRAADEDTPKAEQSATNALVSGTVVDVAGKPAPDVTVWLIGGAPFDKVAKRLAETTTDKDGRFDFPNATVENTFGPGMRRPAILARDAHKRLGWQRLRQQAEARGATIELLDVTTATGRIVDADGAPIANAEIKPRFLRKQDFRSNLGYDIALFPELIAEFTTRTNDDGAFSVPNVPAGGSVGSTVSAQGFGAPRIMWNANVLTTIRLARAGSLSGKLVAPVPSAPLGDVKLSVRLPYSTDRSQAGEFYLFYMTDVLTKPDGTFVANGLPPGQYTLTPSLEGRHPFYLEPIPPIEIKPGEASAPVTLIGKPTITVQGQVVDAKTKQGVADVIVYVVSHQRPARDSRPTTTDGDGRFLAHVMPGVLEVTAFGVPDGYAAPLSQLSRPFATTKQDTDWPTIELTRAEVVTAFVVDDAGQPVANAEVRVIVAKSPRSREEEHRTDSRGRFEVHGVPSDDAMAIRIRTATATSDGSVVITPEELIGPLKITISPTHAFRLRGRVADAGGAPIPQASVELHWTRQYVSKHERMAGVGSRLDVLTTDSDGRFESGPLWGGDAYEARVSADGFRDRQFAKVDGQSGQVLDLGELVLSGAGGFVGGVVIDSAGRPVADALVFNQGESIKRVETRTDPQGRFRLEGLLSGPVYVFVETAGFRFAGLRTSANRGNVTVTLRKTDEPGPTDRTVATPDVSKEQEKKAARQLLAALKSHPRADAYQIARALARIDSEAAMEWVQDSGNDRAAWMVHVTAAEKAAETDVDDALALIAENKGYYAFEALKRLAERYATTAPAKGLRFAEEAVVRARAMQQPQQTISLALMPAVLRQLGQEQTARTIAEELAEAAAKMSGEGRQAFARGLVAAAIAPFEPDQAAALLKPITDMRELARYRSSVAAAIAPHDVEKAIALINDAEDPLRPDRCKLRVAYAIAPNHPRRAIEIIEAITHLRPKVEALGWVADALAEQDRPLAYSLIERAVNALVESAQGTPRILDQFGNAAGHAAWLAIRAEAIAYPHVDEIVSRALSLRDTTESVHSPIFAVNSHISVAMILAFTDVSAARHILERVDAEHNVSRAGPTLFGRGSGQIDIEHWLEAWALVDPARAVELAERAIADVKADGPPTYRLGPFYKMADILTVDRSGQFDIVLERRSGAFWFPGEG